MIRCVAYECSAPCKLPLIVVGLLITIWSCSYGGSPVYTCLRTDGSRSQCDSMRVDVALGLPAIVRDDGGSTYDARMFVRGMAIERLTKPQLRNLRSNGHMIEVR